MPNLFNGAVCPPAPLLLSACRQRLKCRAGVCQRPSGSEVSAVRQVHSTLLAICLFPTYSALIGGQGQLSGTGCIATVQAEL